MATTGLARDTPSASKKHLRRLAGMLSIMLLSLASCRSEAFEIHRAGLRRIAGEYVLDTDISFDFSPAAIEALENSVPLTMVLRCRIDRIRPYWFNEPIVDYRRQLHIRYHPLGQLFEMTVDDNPNRQSYTTLGSLLDAMGSIRRLPVFSAEKLKPEETYEAELTISLDIETLPLPLRPTAYLSPGWYLSSPPYRWSFAKSD